MVLKKMDKRIDAELLAKNSIDTDIQPNINNAERYGSEKDYWENYYKSHKDPIKPSPFALFVSDHIDSDESLCELGCGNGRDSVYFHKRHSLEVHAIDQCEEEMDFLNSNYGNDQLKFYTADFTNLDYLNRKFDNIYSRFSLHAVDEDGEDRVINWVPKILNPGGKLFIEVRSINDPLCGAGAKVGETEFVTDHYRRFSCIDALIDKIKSRGLQIVYSVESNGLAVYKDEDPTVIRLICKFTTSE
jgi:tellurite methyltransferase